MAISTSQGGSDPNAIHDNVASEISAITEKASPVSADLLLIEDSAAANVKKKVQLGNIPGIADIGARVYNNANISVADITLQALTFNSEQYDTDGIHSTTLNTGRLTCQTAGKYLIGGNVRLISVTLTSIHIRLNGSTVIAISSQAASSVETYLSVNTVYPLAVGNYVELLVYHSDGAPVNANYNAAYTPYFWMQLLAIT